MTTYRIALLHRLDRYPRSAPTSQLIRPASDRSTRKSEKTRSAREVAAPLLAVLVVVLTIAAIVGLTTFGDDGNARAFIGAGVAGMSSAVLGLVFGFLKAHQSS